MNTLRHAVHPGSRHLNQHLIGSWLGNRPGGRNEPLRTTRCGHFDDLHVFRYYKSQDGNPPRKKHVRGKGQKGHAKLSLPTGHCHSLYPMIGVTLTDARRDGRYKPGRVLRL
jgi:hypothetical protein